MDAIQSLLQVDFVAWVLVLFTIIIGLTAAATTIIKFCEIIGKPIKWVKNKNDDHDLLVKTSQSLEELKTKHNTDIKDSKMVMDEFIVQMRDLVGENSRQINQFANNRIHDREQSFAIQKELSDAIKKLTESAANRDEQVKSLMVGVMEMLGDKIDEKFNRYVELGGIPANEVDEFSGIYHAYAGLGGNHSREEKFKYVKEHMEVIPVEVMMGKK